ncbi:MAG: hypothetical protein PHC62_00820 [Candidatus Izemoplasmatales bacterium]|nr:hypothetical protein [Candidatus Izemoplasmatales bacterium]
MKVSIASRTTKVPQSKKIATTNAKNFEDCIKELFSDIDQVSIESLPFLTKTKLYEYFKNKIVNLNLNNQQQESHVVKVIFNAIEEIPRELFKLFEIKSQRKILIDYLQYRLDIRGFAINETEIDAILSHISTLVK